MWNKQNILHVFSQSWLIQTAQKLIYKQQSSWSYLHLYKMSDNFNNKTEMKQGKTMGITTAKLINICKRDWNCN
jgi:hypothetical protein